MANGLRTALVYVGAPESPAAAVMTPPAGVQILAGVVLEAGFDAQLFDSRLLEQAELIHAVDEYDPQVVGLSFLSPSASDAEVLAGKLRRPGRVLVAGGVHASLHANALVERDVFDCVVRQEGESAIVDICASIEAGVCPPPLIDGTAVRRPDEVARYPDLDCYRAVYEASPDYRSV